MFNSLPWERHEVIQIQDGVGKSSLGMYVFYIIFTEYTVFIHLVIHGICCSAALVTVPSIGVSPVKDVQNVTAVSVTVQVCTSI